MPGVTTGYYIERDFQLQDKVQLVVGLALATMDH